MNVSGYLIRRDQRGNWSGEITIESERLPKGKAVRVTVMKRSSGKTMSTATCGKLEKTQSVTSFSYDPFFDFSIIVGCEPRCTDKAVERMLLTAQEQAVGIVDAAVNYYLTKPAKVGK